MRAGLTQHFGARDSGQIQIKDECLVGGGRGGEFGCGRLAVRPVSGIAVEEPENMEDDLGDRGTIFRQENMGRGTGSGGDVIATAAKGETDFRASSGSGEIRGEIGQKPCRRRGWN